MSGIVKVSPTSEPQKPLYAMLFEKGVPVIVEGRHSTFRTDRGKSIQNLRSEAYAMGATGRFSRVQVTDDYVVKHLMRHYSPDLVLQEVRNLIKCIGNPQVV